MQQTGKVTVKVNGSSLRSKTGSGSMIPGGLTREDNSMTDQGVFMYKEKYEPGEIKCVVMHCADTDVRGMQDSKEVTVSFEADTGAVYTMANAVCTKVGETKDGEVEVTFRGDPIKS